MQQNSTTQPVISKAEIEKLLGSEKAEYFNNLNPLTLLLLNDEWSEDNIKAKLAEALSRKNGKQPIQEEVDSLYTSLKKVATFIEEQKSLPE
jgi:hypothetical protein